MLERDCTGVKLVRQGLQDLVRRQNPKYRFWPLCVALQYTDQCPLMLGKSRVEMSARIYLRTRMRRRRTRRHALLVHTLIRNYPRLPPP